MYNKKNANVLIIDDDIMTRTLIQMQLKTLAYKVTCVENEISALKKLQNENYSAVICDLKLQDSNGLDILKKIKKKYKNIPVIMLSGYSDEKYIKKSKALGSFDFLSKPISKKKLIEILKKAIKISK